MLLGSKEVEAKVNKAVEIVIAVVIMETTYIRALEALGYRFFCGIGRTQYVHQNREGERTGTEGHENGLNIGDQKGNIRGKFRRWLIRGVLVRTA